MAKKILYIDVETTGRNWARHDIVQMGIIIEVDGEVKEEANIRSQPVNWEAIEPEALEVTGLTIEELKTYPTPDQAYQQLLAILGKYVDKYDKTDKYYPAGYNVEFDLNFFSSFFQKNNDKYLGSWINWMKLDPLPYLFLQDYLGKIKLENYKLKTVCEHFGIEIDAHDAFSDIKATRELFKKLTAQGLSI